MVVIASFISTEDLHVNYPLEEETCITHARSLWVRGTQGACPWQLNLVEFSTPALRQNEIACILLQGGQG